MKLKFPNIIKDNNASVMVEFILIFPLFILLVFGTIEFALLSLAHQNVNYASFNAARAEIVGMDPDKSGWMSLYMLSPHYVQNLSPLESLKLKLSNFDFGSVNFDNRFDFYFNFMIESPCLLKFFGFKSPLYEFSEGGSIELFGNTVRNIEDFLNGILSLLAGEASDMVNATKEVYNEGVDNAGYAIPPFLRKLLYAISFTEVSKQENSDPEIPTVDVSVTYYYILKFPVIQSIFYYLHRMWNTGDEKIFDGTGDKWAKANEFSDKTGFKFIPITYSCTLGDEKQFIK